MALDSYYLYKTKASVFVKTSKSISISYYARIELCESLACYYGMENAYVSKYYNCIFVRDRFQLFVQMCNSGSYEVSIHDSWYNKRPNVDIRFGVEIDSDKIIFLLENWNDRFNYLTRLDIPGTKYVLAC